MSNEIRHFTATIPAGTPLASPVTVNIAMPVRTVSRIDWRVPVGPSGVMGWQLAMGGVKVLPFGDLYVIADGQDGSWDLEGQPDSGAWQVIGYNTGVYPHSVYLAFHVAPVTARPTPLAPVLPPWVIGPSPDLSQAGPPIAGR